MGYNGYYQFNLEHSDTTYVMTTVPDVSGVAHVGGSPHGTCAVLTGGSIKCWGDNKMMYFGDGQQDKAGGKSKVPVSVSGLSNATDITAGEGHSCVLISGGTVKCWGVNRYGELGDNTKRIRSTPVSVSGLSGVSEVTAGSGFTCARLSDGTAKCWGALPPYTLSISATTTSSSLSFRSVV
jgi:alpha-tubulin suppressor-like RCC1 family protein